MAPATGVGQFVSWDGGCLLIGRARDVVPLHAHYAIQVAFGAEPGIRFRPDDGTAWTAYDAALIPSRQPHAMDASGTSASAVLLVEPETREGRALGARHPAGGITALTGTLLDEARTSLFAVWREARDPATLAAAAQRVAAALAGGLVTSAPSDPRILRAAAYIRSHLEGPVTLEAVAAEVCLSPGRFRHLFVAETGMTLRAYVLWRRFLRVWELLMAGSPISAAAHRAGFADAAHLTRTSRRMFGLPPSAFHLVAPRPDDRRA